MHKHLYSTIILPRNLWELRCITGPAAVCNFSSFEVGAGGHRRDPTIVQLSNVRDVGMSTGRRSLRLFEVFVGCTPRWTGRRAALYKNVCYNNSRQIVGCRTGSMVSTDMCHWTFVEPQTRDTRHSFSRSHQIYPTAR